MVTQDKIEFKDEDDSYQEPWNKVRSIVFDAPE